MYYYFFFTIFDVTLNVFLPLLTSPSSLPVSRCSSLSLNNEHGVIISSRRDKVDFRVKYSSTSEVFFQTERERNTTVSSRINFMQGKKKFCIKVSPLHSSRQCFAYVYVYIINVVHLDKRVISSN